MNYIELQLQEEKKKLENYVRAAKERLKSVPEGRLRISKKENFVEYYLKDAKREIKETKPYENEKYNGSTSIQNLSNGKYIKKENLNIANQIAQRDYDMSLLDNAEKRIKAIDIFLKKYQKTNISKLYEKTNEYRRKLLDYAVLSDAEYVRRWESVEYEGKHFGDDTIEIYTDRGERVRSKSEKIIADRLNVLGIPYRYEYPLQLKDNVTVYPDFTLLNIDTKEEVYLEHCGLMDEQEYVERWMYKLKTYERNEIYLGVNLFITYETSRFPFNGKVLDGLIKNLFCCTKHNILIK